jgi:hypothetical protein
MNQVASAGGQQTVQAGPLYGLSHQGHPPAATYGSNYAPLSSSAWPSNNKQEAVFPERPGQPECHHYMKTGTCKFGATCKYNHPQYSTPRSNYMLSPLGLPIRPVSSSNTSVCGFLVSTMLSPRKLPQKHTIWIFGSVVLD